MSVEEMKAVNPETVDKSTLVRRSDITVDPDLDKKDHLIEVIRKLKNPYCYLVGDVVVKLDFLETERTMNDCVRGYLAGV